jgi:DNA mismatch repair ATPase MutS
LRGLADVFGHAVHEKCGAEMLVDLKARMGDEDSVSAFAQFDRLAKFGEVRLSPMGHFVVHALTLWDFHVVDAVERWRDMNGKHVRERLRALGEFEALSALATLAYDNPTWAMPKIAIDASHALVAKELAHPLLVADEAVTNDLSIGEAGQILLITGSNMSGKSTLLRSIALNVVLAQIGAPVCASSLRLSPHRVRTSIDARDALDRGLSLFMAELLRIKSIVDAAQADAAYPLLYVADEMLRGTNATDRHAAVISILEKLVASGAVGAVATHDPEVANDAGLKPHFDSYHFIEHFDPTRTAMPMWFDYKLRPGLSTTRNAIKLLEIVGLGGA